MKRRFLKNVGRALLFFFVGANVHAATTDLANVPLVTSSTSSVLPNLMFVLDDSGSMGWAYLPDWANVSNQTLFRNNTFNGVAYNPSVTYSPPILYNADATINTATYPSMTSANTATWASVPNDGYGVQSTSTSNLAGNAYYYTFIAGEYCDKPNLRNCVTQSAPTGANLNPATLRWCTSSAMTTCQAVRIETGTNQFTYARYPISATTTITVSGTNATTVTGITVNSVQILNATTPSTTSSTTMAANIASRITLAGYSATSSGSTVTITAPIGSGAITYLPVVTKGTGTMTITPSAFNGGVPGSNLRTDIVSGTSSYPYPGTAAKATTRTDCAGATCTYAEEMTNYANWWAYYHTRMQMMKTSASIAFQTVGSTYRVGYATINGNQTNGFVNLDAFNITQKRTWYSKLFAAVPNNSTPLRSALSKIGRLYAGKFNGSTFDGVTVIDPMQYSCQQNFTILSTDGYWNDSSGYYQVNGSTNVGNQDAGEPRPMFDGGSSSNIYTATISISGSSTNDNRVSSITVNGREIMFERSTSDNSSSTLASSVVNKINACTSATTGNCQVSGYSASRSGSVVTITAPAALGAITSAPVVTKSGTGSKTFAASAFQPTVITSGGTSNTLADVAEYYYINDLRTSALGNCTGAPIAPATTGIDVCTDDVRSSGLDAASWQHMTTFTLGLGVSGYMQYSPTYPNSTSGDYFDVKNGTTANPIGGICSWQSSGVCNWPAPVSDEQTTVDDLWHAAVNGRGTYFSATNPASLNAGLSSALAGINALDGSAAAATTSNPNVTSGDNFVFSSTFTSQEWTGELERQQLDVGTGVVSTGVGDWKARDKLDTNTSRTFYAFDATAGNKLKAFDWANLTAAQQAYFTTPNISTLSQFCASGVTCLSAANQTAAAGANLVNFLRGDRINEGISTDTTKYYRQRVHVLGDIVNAEAVYVKLPLFGYADAEYTAFITAQASRQGMVYVAANDGMLHAFNATTGAEAFTYIPSLVLPNLYKLADKNYANLHQYFVDGTPVAGDVFFGGAWHTIAVGGLNGGGRGYYALDVTNPAAPVALWEFTDTNMGYTFGNPTITKLQDGTWVVLVTSGYNNVSPGDGVGRLYVINAGTGALIRTISTGVGSTTTPSGLARISAWVNNTTTDNTALRAYGGDMLGNLWRFDINDNVGAAGYDAQLLVTLYADVAGTVTEPITTRPELGDVGGVAVVFVGTGSFLGVGDLSDTTQQTFYGVKDTLGTTTHTNPKAAGSNFVQQIVTNGTCPAGSPPTICSTGQAVRTSTSNTVNFATNNGWYVSLPDSGERANTDPTLALGTLGFTTNIPNTNACTAGGYSYRYLLDYRTGAPVSTSTTGVSAIKLGNALSTRGVFVRLPNNTVVQLTRLSDGTTVTTNVPIGTGIGPTRRVSWRELIQDQ